jgi:hypothetical protein
MRLAMDYATSEELQGCLTHLLDSAGNPTLMTYGIHSFCAANAIA